MQSQLCYCDSYATCLVKYTKQKCRANFVEFQEPWRICTNCKQPFQNQLSIDLTSSFISFTEEAYDHAGNSKWDKMNIMIAHQLKICAMGNSNKIQKVEKVRIINKLLLVVDGCTNEARHQDEELDSHA